MRGLEKLRESEGFKIRAREFEGGVDDRFGRKERNIERLNSRKMEIRERDDARKVKKENKIKIKERPR